MKTKKVLLTGLMILLLLLTMPGTIMAAGKKTVYVLTSVTQKSEYIRKETKLSYNKKGLLSKATIPSTSLGWPDSKLKASYSSKGILQKVTIDDYTRTITHSFSYKSGKLSKHTTVTKSASNDKSTSTMTYQWKGKAFTVTIKEAGETESTATGKLNSKNRLLSLTTKDIDGALVENRKYQYDSKGFLKSISHDAEKTTFKNTVKSGRLKKRTDNNSTAYSFKYKKIKVPSSYVKKVKAQQNYILDNLTEGWYSFAYPSW